MNQKLFNLIRITLTVIAAALLTASLIAAVFAMVPLGAARYVMSHGSAQTVGAEQPADPDAALKADDFKAGMSDFGVLLSTELSNIGSGFKGIITVEAGSELNARTLSDAAGRGVEPLADLSSIPTDDIGYYRVPVSYGGRQRRCLLIITDSQAPAITVAARDLWVGDTPSAEDFILSASDATAVEYRFVTEPDCGAAGPAGFEVAATDRGGNVTTAALSCEVAADTEPPVISGAEDRTIYIGENVLYKDGVSASDNRDGDSVPISVDISAVDPTSEGEYPVTYSAVDSTGLTSSVTVTYTFMYTHEDTLINQLNAELQPIIDSIIKEGMTEREKAKAVYKWVRGHITYVGYSNKNSWYECALEGMRTRVGDCYTFASISKALLTGAGLENIDVVRDETPKQPGLHHYWNLVRVEGEWYHFDVTPRNDGSRFFLVTSDELLAYSNSHSDSHLFNPDDYPKTP